MELGSTTIAQGIWTFLVLYGVHSHLMDVAGPLPCLHGSCTASAYAPPSVLDNAQRRCVRRNSGQRRCLHGPFNGNGERSNGERGNDMVKAKARERSCDTDSRDGMHTMETYL